MRFHEVKLSQEHQGTLPIPMPRNFGAIWKVWPLVLEIGSTYSAQLEAQAAQSQSPP